jgi:hypothetical protein
MGMFSTPLSKSASWPITVGAEGIAAAQFARCGFDVLVQAGRDKPWYDLVVTKGGNLLKVSVKASETGEWALTSGYTRKIGETHGMRVDCRSAIDMWRAGYGSRTVCCLVQFAGVDLHELPRIYLASPDEIAAAMHQTADRTGRCSLVEMYEWNTGNDRPGVEVLPEKWHFSHARVQELLIGQGNGAAATKSPAAAVRELAMAH